MDWNPFARHGRDLEPAAAVPGAAGGGASASAPSPGAAASSPPPPAERAPEDIREEAVIALRGVYDPEIPVNIYDLGLVYELQVTPPGDIHVRMTLTAPSCPAAGMLPGEVETRLRAIPGVREVRVELVWDPPWGPDRMSESARLQLTL